MRRSACLVFNPITVNNFASLLNCTPVCQASDSMMAPTYYLVGAGAFLSVAWPTGVQLLFFFCFSVPLVLFITPGISKCRSQHVVSVESSSLFHHSMYPWFICFPWWSIDELGNLHVDRTTVYFEPWQKPRAWLGSRKTGLSSPICILILTAVVPYCNLFLLSVFILWISYYVNDIFSKF